MAIKPSLVQFAVDNNLTICWNDVIKPGDFYIAERNTGPKLLECAEISRNGFIIPTSSEEYCFDVWECVKVTIS